jgi:hypothetical protein
MEEIEKQFEQITTLSLEGDLKAAISILTDKTDIVETPEGRIVGACHEGRGYSCTIDGCESFEDRQRSDVS